MGQAHPSPFADRVQVSVTHIRFWHHAAGGDASTKLPRHRHKLSVSLAAVLRKHGPLVLQAAGVAEDQLAGAAPSRRLRLAALCARLFVALRAHAADTQLRAKKHQPRQMRSYNTTPHDLDKNMLQTQRHCNLSQLVRTGLPRRTPAWKARPERRFRSCAAARAGCRLFHAAAASPATAVACWCRSPSTRAAVQAMSATQAVPTAPVVLCPAGLAARRRRPPQLEAL